MRKPVFSESDIRNVCNATAYGSDGGKIGSVGDVYLDDATGASTWVTITVGLFGTRTCFVPMEGAELDGDRLTVCYSREIVLAAPRVEEDEHLSQEEEARLHAHYRGPDADAPDLPAPAADAEVADAEAPDAEASEDAPEPRRAVWLSDTDESAQ